MLLDLFSVAVYVYIFICMNECVSMYVCMNTFMYEHIYVLLNIYFILIQSTEEVLSEDDGDNIDEDESKYT